MLYPPGYQPKHRKHQRISATIAKLFIALGAITLLWIITGIALTY